MCSTNKTDNTASQKCLECAAEKVKKNKSYFNLILFFSLESLYVFIMQEGVVRLYPGRSYI